MVKNKEYKCSICGKKHEFREICPDMDAKICKYEKQRKQQFLYGNIFVECLKKDVNMYDLLYEVSYISELNTNRMFDYGVGIINAEMFIDYCASELQCNPKQFFLNPDKTIANLSEYISSFELAYDDTYYDEGGTATEYIFRISDVIETCSKYDKLNECRLYAKKEKVGKNRWNYSLYFSHPSMFFKNLENVDCFYKVGTGGSILLYEEYSGMLQDTVETYINTSWEDMAKEVPVSNDMYDMWINKLVKETESHNLSWYVSDSKDYFTANLKDTLIRMCSFKFGERDNDYNQLTIRFNKEYAAKFTLDSKDAEKLGMFYGLINCILQQESTIQNLVSQDNLEKKEILFSDVVVVSSSMYCKRKEHSIKPYRGIVTLLTKENTEIEYEIYVGYCRECDTYTVFDKDYRKMLEIGQPLCKVYTYQEFLEVKTHTPFRYKSQSVLAAKGYNVQADSNLSEEQRHNLLVTCLDNHIVEVHDLLDFLHWLIKTREPLHKYANAVGKWKKDMELIEKYKNDEKEVVVINSITVKQ